MLAASPPGCTDGEELKKFLQSSQSSDRRAERRYLVEHPATVRIPGVGEYPATILDVSAAGLRVNCSTAALVGMQVEVSLPDLTVRGEVRYVRETTQGEFHWGIQVEAGKEGELQRLLGVADIERW